jgi:hypothetical protein
MKEKEEVQPFEIAVARKLEARSNPLLDTFLHLDTDGDGSVTRNDLKAALHNLWGIDLSEDEMNAFSRFAHLNCIIMNCIIMNCIIMVFATQNF